MAYVNVIRSFLTLVDSLLNQTGVKLLFHQKQSQRVETQEGAGLK